MSWSIELIFPNKSKVLNAIKHASCRAIVIIHKLDLLSFLQVISLKEIMLLLSFQKFLRRLQLLAFQKFPIKFLKEIMILDIIDVLYSQSFVDISFEQLTDQ